MRPVDKIWGTERTRAFDKQQCMPPPIGCGGPATSFKNEISIREYGISALCQNCQDKVFGMDEPTDI